MMKRLICAALALMVSALGESGPRGMGGGQKKSSDAALQAMIADVAPKFRLQTYEDPEIGDPLQYQLYIPENYDGDILYPLVLFMPDMSAVGRGAEAVLTQGWGGLIWASAAEQAKHPCFVLVPVFEEIVVDDAFNHSEQLDTAVSLIGFLEESYSIDSGRVYITGQSMGGMASFYLNLACPNLFAASLFVGSQWDNEQLNALEDSAFFYVVAAGDPKASAGQSGLMAVFDADGAPYSHGQWSAQDDAQAQNAAVKALLEEGHRANFVTFTQGSTLSGGDAGNSRMGEHMTSFDYAYRLEAVRDWLFEQALQGVRR